MVQALKGVLLGIFALHSTLLIALFLNLLPLSLLTFGGVNSILPPLHELTVEHMHWLRDKEFYELLALAFAAPGPNMLFVTMIGSRVAGFPGACIATFAVVGPPALLVATLSRWWFHQSASPKRRVLQSGILPVTTGIFAMATLTILHAVVHTPVGLALSIVTLVVVLRTQVHPLWLLALGGAIGGIIGV